MQVEIKKLDNLGQGIAYVNDLITFVPKTIPGDIVEIKIVKKKKKYQNGQVIKYIKRGNSFVQAKCPYYALCGGCALQNLSYEATLQYKKNKLKDLLAHININVEPTLIANDNPYNYRNKIKLQVVNKEIGFYFPLTHNLVKITSCDIASPAINRVIPNLKEFNITNGEIIIRSNPNDELLIIINSSEEIQFSSSKLREIAKIAGIVVNGEVKEGDSHLIALFNHLIFKYSYDSFFQVNFGVAQKMWELLNENIEAKSKVLDLYCGVGTLSLVAASKGAKVVGIENVLNATVNATFNAKINKLNAKFLYGKVEDILPKIPFDYDTVIIDPPRSGLAKSTLDILKKYLVKKIIYISCNPDTLVRDLDSFKNYYQLEKSYLLDMFSYTYHVECVCVLKLR